MSTTKKYAVRLKFICGYDNLLGVFAIASKKPATKVAGFLKFEIAQLLIRRFTVARTNQISLKTNVDFYRRCFCCFHHDFARYCDHHARGWNCFHDF